jgi:hypothetical protein
MGGKATADIPFIFLPSAVGREQETVCIIMEMPARESFTPACLILLHAKGAGRNFGHS